jgi:phytoene synthase
MAKFNYSEDELVRYVYNENFRDLMAYEVRRAKTYFDAATSCLNLDDKRAMFAARAMQHIYYKMLNKIIDADYDVFNKNIKVSKIQKVGIAIGVWAKYQLVY